MSLFDLNHPYHLPTPSTVLGRYFSSIPTSMSLAASSETDDDTLRTSNVDVPFTRVGDTTTIPWTRAVYFFDPHDTVYVFFLSHPGHSDKFWLNSDVWSFGRLKICLHEML